MCPREHPQGQGRPVELHFCPVHPQKNLYCRYVLRTLIEFRQPLPILLSNQIKAWKMFIFFSQNSLILDLESTECFKINIPTSVLLQ